MLSLLARRALATGVARQAACSSIVSLKQFSSSAAAWSAAAVAPSPADEERRAMINKMLYRSRQRGWLELDLLIGMWAERTLPHLKPAELADFEEVLGLENPDLFKWLTGQLEAPQEMVQNKAYQLIAAHVREMMEAKSQAAAQSAKGAEWRRGWDDWGGKELKKPEEKEAK